jgi:hypothetical protein
MFVLCETLAEWNTLWNMIFIFSFFNLRQMKLKQNLLNLYSLKYKKMCNKLVYSDFIYILFAISKNSNWITFLISLDKELFWLTFHRKKDWDELHCDFGILYRNFMNKHNLVGSKVIADIWVMLKWNEMKNKYEFTSGRWTPLFYFAFNNSSKLKVK